MTFKLIPGEVTWSTQGDFINVASKPLPWIRYSLAKSAEPALAALPIDDALALRRRIWEEARNGTPLNITSYDLKPGTLGRLPHFEQCAVDLLNWIKLQKPFGQYVEVSTRDVGGSFPPEVPMMLGVDGQGEVNFFLDYLKAEGWVAQPGQIPHHVRLMPAGLIHLERLRDQGSTSTKAFVAMWFGEAMDSAWHKAMRPAIEDAGYEAMRIDAHEHINRIDDEIIAQIRQSRFVVADFSCEPGKPRGGVYFEAGFALGLGLPVIWTAADHMKSEIHFDIRQYNMIFWKDEADLRQRLTTRIVALLGPGRSGKEEPAAGRLLRM